jgi:hypothetical protein
LKKLPVHFQKSFASLDILLQNMSMGYDPHYMIFTHKNDLDHPSALGLFAFNVDTMMQKQTDKQLRVNLYHLSSLLGAELFGPLVDSALEYIWKHMHCAVVRLSLYHYEEGGRLQVSTAIKNLLKARGFKWKTVTNEGTLSRVEILECSNAHGFKEQANPLKCVVYRRGLTREDVHKEPFTLRVNTFVALTDKRGPKVATDQSGGSALSICGVLNSVMKYRKSLNDLTGFIPPADASGDVLA